MSPMRRGVSNSEMSEFEPIKSKDCGISLPPYMIQHLNSIRGNYPRSKLVLMLIKKSLELKEEEKEVYNRIV